MIAYIAPFALYIVCSQFLSDSPDNYPLLYSGTVALTGAAAFILLWRKKVFTVHTRILPGILVGIVGIIAWIFICSLNLEQNLMAYLPEWLQPDDRAAFNPFTAIDSRTGQYGFIAIRLFGLAVLVPVIEEVFWRGFLARWIVDQNWESQPIGHFTPASFIWITALFTLAHPEWFAAAVYCILINLLLMWKKDLWNCIVAHAISNLLLGIYVLQLKAWALW